VAVVNVTRTLAKIDPAGFLTKPEMMIKVQFNATNIYSYGGNQTALLVTLLMALLIAQY
jgi:hypothetical protein